MGGAAESQSTYSYPTKCSPSNCKFHVVSPFVSRQGGGSPSPSLPPPVPTMTAQFEETSRLSGASPWSRGETSPEAVRTVKARAAERARHHLSTSALTTPVRSHQQALPFNEKTLLALNPPPRAAILGDPQAHFVDALRRMMNHTSPDMAETLADQLEISLIDEGEALATPRGTPRRFDAEHKLF